MPQPKSISPGKGGKPHGKKSKSFGKNMVWFNRTHSFLNLQAKFFKFTFCTLAKFPVNYANSAQFAPKIPQITQNSHHLLIHYTLCFKCLPQQRILKNSSELCKFHANRPHSPRMTRNSHQLFIHLHYVSDACPGREYSEIPANYANSAQFTHIVHE